MKFINGSLGLLILILGACQSPATDNGTKTAQDKLIFKDSSGNVITEKELENITGQVNYEIMEHHNANAMAKTLHDEARALGQEGKYDLSIAKLEEAIKLDPNWAYPVYDLAYTYLLKGDLKKALKFYKKTDEMEPKGFFTAKTAIYSLEGEEAGKFPKGLYMAYMQIEWTDNLNKKLEIAKAIIQKSSDFAPAWKELSTLLSDDKERLNAIEQGLSKKPDAETKGVMEINKAIVFNKMGKEEEAKQLLGNLIFSPDATIGNIALARFTLKSIAEK